MRRSISGLSKGKDQCEGTNSALPPGDGTGTPRAPLITLSGKSFGAKPEAIDTEYSVIYSSIGDLPLKGAVFRTFVMDLRYRAFSGCLRDRRLSTEYGVHIKVLSRKICIA